MKKIIISLVFTIIGITVFAQFATFEPIIQQAPSSMPGSMPSNEVGSTSQVTGYILDEAGYVVSKIKLRVVVTSTPYGESVKIIGYYNVNPGFGAAWVSTSVSAQPIGGQSPITEQQKVAYANFMYRANWNTSVIWF